MNECLGIINPKRPKPPNAAKCNPIPTLFPLEDEHHANTPVMQCNLNQNQSRPSTIANEVGYMHASEQASKRIYKPTAMPRIPAAIATPAPAVFMGTPAPLEPTGVGLLEPVFSAAATCTPKLVEVTAEPEIVVVKTEDEVVLTVHPLHVVQGAAVLHGPSVQPGQSESGHWEPPHQAVQGAERQALLVDQSDQGPQLPVPHGPGPPGPPQCPGPPGPRCPPGPPQGPLPGP